MNKVEQIDFLENKEIKWHISTEQVSQFCKNSKRRSQSLTGAILRMVEAKTYHDIGSKLSEENLALRMENDKLKEEIHLLTKAN